MKYKGHWSTSFRAFHSSFRLTAWRLCISPYWNQHQRITTRGEKGTLEGSSRSNRFTRIYSSCSVNQPFFPRNHDAVWHGPAGISPHERIPMMAVTDPSIMKRYRHPESPPIPRICKIAAARSDPKMFEVLKAVQNHDNRMGSSFDL